MLIRTLASAVTGIDAVTVTIEVNESRGVQFFFVGLPDSAVKESQHRIVSALGSLNYRWPGKQIVINMNSKINHYNSNPILIPALTKG